MSVTPQGPELGLSESGLSESGLGESVAATPDSATAGGAPHARPAPAQRRRRVVALSPQDRQRVARGEPTLGEQEEAYLRNRDALEIARIHERAAELASPGGGLTPDTANDARLLADVPPHWG